MATSGSIVTSTNFGNVTLTWSRSSVDETNNKSTLYYELVINRSYNISSTAGKSYSIVFNGSTVASGTTTIGGSGAKVIKSGYVDISHNADGTKTFNYSFSQQIDINFNGWIGTVTGSGSSTIDPIPRASQPSGSDPDGWYWYGDNITISTNRVSANFTHTLRYNWSGQTGTIATGVTTSHIWNIPRSFMDLIPNHTYSWGTIFCDTYNGGTFIGTKSFTIYTSVPGDVAPSFTSVVVSENVADIATKIGAYVQSMSKLNLSISGAVGSYSSTISKYEITVESKIYGNNGVSDVLQTSGTLTITGTVTDSRGRTSTKSITITVLAYEPPKITDFTIVRANADGTLNTLGTYAKITRKGTWRSLNTKNTLSIVVKSRARGAATWTTKNTYAAGTSGAVDNSVIIGTYAATSSHEFQIEYTDLFNTTISLGVMATGEVTMSWGKTGIGIGKVWEQGALDLSGDVHINGNMNISGSIVQPSPILIPTINGWGKHPNHKLIQYQIDSFGWLTIEGSVNGGTYSTGGVIGTLPVGARPLEVRYVIAVGWSAAGGMFSVPLAIVSTGEIRFNNNAGSWSHPAVTEVHMNGIKFRVGA
jgi:hypothetical protein